LIIKNFKKINIIAKIIIIKIKREATQLQVVLQVQVHLQVQHQVQVRVQTLHLPRRVVVRVQDRQYQEEKVIKNN
jgi:hypothetical protein